LIVDAHQHFWDPARAHYPWLTDEVAPLRRRFGPEDLEPELRRHGVGGTVLVQARSSLDETRALLETAATTDFVLGVVGWIDLTDPGAARALADPSGPLVGVRHQVHDEPESSWLLRTDVQRGLAAVADARLVYDLLVRTAELPAAVETASRHPELSFVLDHVGKPPLRSGELDAWAGLVAQLAELPNVTCKLSGLVTEAEPGADLAPILEYALRCFGADRCMFGSDWPVCLLAADYGTVLALVRDAVPERDRDAVLGGTAVRIYGLSVSDSAESDV
jgi:L-fucono-1,5-lactonase